MGVYPVMYALLDVERTIQGLPELEAIEFYDLNQSAGGYFYWSEELRRGPVRELARTFQHDHQWLLEEVPEGFEKSSRAIVFTLDGSHEEDKNATVTIAARYQVALPEVQRSQYVLADVSFSGEKWEETLPICHPLHPIVLAFLKAVQPVHALVMGDSFSPFHDQEFFRQQWKHVTTSTFLGPELIEVIPPELLSLNAGFAHLEQVGAGLWITVPGVAANLEEGVVNDAKLYQHYYAGIELEKFLKTAPNLLPDERD